MYDKLVKRLRDAAKMSEALAVLIPHSEGDATAKLYNKAADAIEELSACAELYQNLTEKSQQTARKVIDASLKWISVEKDGLPSKPNEYLVYVRDGITDKQTDIPDLDIDLSYVTTAYFDPDTCLWNENQEYYNGNLDCVNKNKVYYISHWANKPKPPKEANDAQR